MVSNRQTETPKSTVELKFDVDDIEFYENFILMDSLTGLIIRLLFLRRNHTVLDLRRGILNFPFVSMQLKTADHRYCNALEPIIIPTEITIPPKDKFLIRTNSLLYPENAKTGILQPSDLLHEEWDISFCLPLVTLADGNVQIPVNSFQNPYKLKKGLHFANFSFMTPEQMKYVKPVVPVSTWHLLQNDQEQAVHNVSSLIKTNKNPYLLQRILETPTNSRLYRKESYGKSQALQDLGTLVPQKMRNPDQNSQKTGTIPLLRLMK